MDAMVASPWVWVGEEVRRCQQLGQRCQVDLPSVGSTDTTLYLKTLNNAPIDAIFFKLKLMLPTTKTKHQK